MDWLEDTSSTTAFNEFHFQCNRNTGTVHFLGEMVVNKEEKKCLFIVSFLPAVCVWTCMWMFQMLKHKIFVKEEKS